MARTSFSESISVSAGAPQGTTITCQVEFLLNGQSGGPSFVETIRVSVTDVTPPVVNVPSLTVEATGPNGAVIDYTATATDNVDGAITPSCTPPPGSTFPIAPTTPGVTTVTCTATDAAGNTTTATGTMTVVDTTPPVLNLPAPIVVEATGPNGAVVNYTATATDIVDVTTPVNCDPASRSTFPVGVGSTTTTVNCRSTDKHGNMSTGSFTVTVRDTTPPQPSCPATTNPSGKNVPKAGSNPKSGQNPDGFYELQATDLVDPDPQVFLLDTGSGTVFGPFPSGTKNKYTQAGGATPGQKPMDNGAVQWHITGNGDAAVYGVDASGNTSPHVACLVPRPPK